MHLYKKSLLALGALLLSVTPAVADDIIYMKCETNTVVKAVHNLTDKVLVDKTEPTTIVHQIDLQKRLWHHLYLCLPRLDIEQVGWSWR